MNMGSLTSGSIFQPYTPILSLGIQSLPGTKVYINGADFPIVIGYSGIYELKVEQASPIRSIYFDAESLSHINFNPNGYLIIDIIYDNGGA